jgi:hypothetical protein
MRIVLHATLGLAAMIAVAAQPRLAHAATAPRPAQDTTKLSSRLAGTWTGEVTNSGSARAQRLSMVWRKAPDGHMTGTVVSASGAKYPVNVVWSSDTAFIAESAPHRSPLLGTNVVTRSVFHFKAHALEGTFEARPTTYSAETLTGHFTVTRTS